MRKTERIPLMMERELVEEIDDFRHARKIGSRAEAVRRLIKAALVENKSAATGSKFGDQNPAAAGDINNLETEDADRT